MSFFGISHEENCFRVLTICLSNLAIGLGVGIYNIIYVYIHSLAFFSLNQGAEFGHLWQALNVNLVILGFQLRKQILALWWPCLCRSLQGNRCLCWWFPAAGAVSHGYCRPPARSVRRQKGRTKALFEVFDVMWPFWLPCL